jgi:iron transport multicopper oxidase
MQNHLLLLGLGLLVVARAAVVEHYWDVTWVWAAPDGYGRPVIGVNGSWPCPSLVATKGDEVVVHVRNLLGNQTTGMHWHGIDQVGTNYMDGSVMATQCPIPPNMTTTYRFTVRDLAGCCLRGDFLTYVTAG